ncbi:hypothetical protein SLS56_010426 [Neofusicoccum ribis]|uniref:Uncharacterized protein n=1 Tax=Neofusicoccum ribis TaxID=45134 RepID=A0ABR3SEL7_9PEZI
MSATSDPTPCPEVLALVQRLQDLYDRITTTAANSPYPTLSSSLHELADHVGRVVTDATQQATRLIIQNERLSRPFTNDQVRSEAEDIWKSNDSLPNGASLRELRRYVKSLQDELNSAPEAFRQIALDFNALCDEVLDECQHFHGLIIMNKRLRRKHARHELWEAKRRLAEQLDNGTFTKDPDARQPTSENVGEMSERLDNIAISDK